MDFWSLSLKYLKCLQHDLTIHHCSCLFDGGGQRRLCPGLSSGAQPRQRCQPLATYGPYGCFRLFQLGLQTESRQCRPSTPGRHCKALQGLQNVAIWRQDATGPGHMGSTTPCAAPGAEPRTGLLSASGPAKRLHPPPSAARPHL